MVILSNNVEAIEVCSVKSRIKIIDFNRNTKHSHHLEKEIMEYHTFLLELEFGTSDKCINNLNRIRYFFLVLPQKHVRNFVNVHPTIG